MKITCRQLRRLIKEAIDVVNSETGEIIEFGPGGRIKNQMPDAAWPDLQRRLGITVIGDTASGDPEISSEDWYKLEAEFYGKQDTRLKKLVSSDSSSWDPYAGIAGDGELSDSEARDLEGLVYDATTDALSDEEIEASMGWTPARDPGPMTPEEQQKEFDRLVDSPPYPTPQSLLDTGNYPDVESLDSEVARRWLQRTMGEQTVKITRKQLRRIIKEETRALKEAPTAGEPPAWAVWAAGLRGNAGDDSHRVSKLSSWHDWLRRLQSIYRDESRDRKSSKFAAYTSYMAPNTAKFKEAMNEIIDAATWLRDNAPKN